MIEQYKAANAQLSSELKDLKENAETDIKGNHIKEELINELKKSNSDLNQQLHQKNEKSRKKGKGCAGSIFA